MEINLIDFEKAIPNIDRKRYMIVGLTYNNITSEKLFKKSILDLLVKKKNKIHVVIITNNNNKLSKLDISKFNEQYPKLKVIVSNKYHEARNVSQLTKLKI